jgi:hypothetical protein
MERTNPPLNATSVWINKDTENRYGVQTIPPIYLFNLTRWASLLANNGGKLNIVFENFGLETQDPENYLHNRQKLIEEMYTEIERNAKYTPAYKKATTEDKNAVVEQIKNAIVFQSLNDIKQKMSDDLIEIEKNTKESEVYKNATEEEKSKILNKATKTVFLKKKSEYDEEIKVITNKIEEDHVKYEMANSYRERLFYNNILVFDDDFINKINKDSMTPAEKLDYFISYTKTTKNKFISPAFIANIVKLYIVSKSNNIIMDAGVLCPDRGQRKDKDKDKGLEFNLNQNGVFRFPVQTHLSQFDKYSSKNIRFTPKALISYAGKDENTTHSVDDLIPIEAKYANGSFSVNINCESNFGFNLLNQYFLHLSRYIASDLSIDEDSTIALEFDIKYAATIVRNLNLEFIQNFLFINSMALNRISENSWLSEASNQIENMKYCLFYHSLLYNDKSGMPDIFTEEGKQQSLEMFSVLYKHFINPNATDEEIKKAHEIEYKKYVYEHKFNSGELDESYEYNDLKNKKDSIFFKEEMVEKSDSEDSEEEKQESGTKEVFQEKVLSEIVLDDKVLEEEKQESESEKASSEDLDETLSLRRSRGTNGQILVSSEDSIETVKSYRHRGTNGKFFKEEKQSSTTVLPKTDNSLEDMFKTGKNLDQSTVKFF